MNKYLIENVNSDDVDFDHVNDDLPRYGEGFDYNGEKSNWCVYAHINKTNEKIYIGISSNLKHRWSNGGNKYCGCDAFYNAIQKYGFDGFKHIVIINGLTESMARLIEDDLIKKYNTLVWKEDGNGYNISFEYLFGRKKEKGMELHRYKYYQYDLNGIYIQSFDSLVQINNLFNVSFGNKCVKRCLEREHHFAFGFLWSTTFYEQLDPFRPTDIKFCDEYHKPTHDKYGQIVQLSIDGNLVKTYNNVYHYTFDSIIMDSVLKCCRNIKHTYNGYIWMFISDYSNQDILFNRIQLASDEYKKFSNNLVRSQSKAVLARNISNNNTIQFDSISDASRQTGYPQQSISNACKNNSIYKGYSWSFLNNSSSKISKRRVVQIDIRSNEIINIFDSITDANNYIKVSKASSEISACCRGKRKTSYGYIWKYYEDIIKE